MSKSTGDHIYTDFSEPSSSKTRPLSVIDLIIRAILSHPQKALTLKEIYDWFEENSNLKDSKLETSHGGWKNVIRQTLSVSKSFKRIFVNTGGPLPKAYWTVDSTDIGTSIRSMESEMIASPEKIIFRSDHFSKEPLKRRRGRKPKSATADVFSSEKGLTAASSIFDGNDQSISTAAIFKNGTNFFETAALEILTGLHVSVFNCLFSDLSEAEDDLRRLDMNSDSFVSTREALALLLAELRHGDRIPVDFLRVWFGDKAIQYEKSKSWWTKLRERWIPFLACWMDDLIVWPADRDPGVGDYIPPLLSDALRNTAFIGRSEMKRFVGIFDVLTFRVKLSPLGDDCCRWTALIFVVYDFCGSVIFRSKAYWTVCKTKNSGQYEADLHRALVISCGSNMEKILCQGQSLLTFSDELNFSSDYLRLPEAVCFVTSRSVRRLLKPRFENRMKSNFGILERLVSPLTSSTEILCLNDIVTICCAVMNLTISAISWDEKEEDEIE